MTEKGHIIGSLGDEQLLLPSRINAALAADDRAKYLLTLLQTALHRAENPERWTSDLRSERLASGVDDVSLDEIIGRAEADDPRFRAIRLFHLRWHTGGRNIRMGCRLMQWNTSH